MNARNLILSGFTTCFVSLFCALPSRAEGANVSMQCSNVFGITFVEQSISPQFGYVINKEDYITTAGGAQKIHKGNAGPFINRIDQFTLPSPAYAAGLAGSFGGRRVVFLFRPGSPLPYGLRVSSGNYPLPPTSTLCFPQPRGDGGTGGGGTGGGGGGGGGTGGCVATSLNNYCAGISSLVAPSSVVNRGTIGLNDPIVPREQPVEAKEPDIHVGEWQGQSWKPQDQS